ncbi:MAG: MmgE/PrpD family protein [Pseudomonadota bacterium]
MTESTIPSTAITNTLAEFAASLRYEDIPAEVSERAKQLLLDITGITVRARFDVDSTDPMRAALERLQMRGDSVVIGDTLALSPTAAALLNGAMAHSLDFDDTHAAGSIHSSAPIVPAALAAAQMADANGKDLIAAIVAGYEIQIRLSLALVPKDHYDRGFHPTATCGAFGAAAAAGRAMGLDAATIASAFGLAGSAAAGSMQFLSDGAWNKRFHVGHAAANGLMAATLAAEGYQGAGEPIEGKAGFLQAYAPEPQPERAVEALGSRWETLSLAVKPYPTCRYSHAALDGLLALRAEHGIDADDVTEIEVGLPEMGWKIIGEGDKHHPSTVVDGQFSMPFCAAVALRAGHMDWDDYAAHLGDEQTLALCRKVSTVVDAQAEAEYPRQMSGVVRVKTTGHSYEKFVRIPKGEPENFVTTDELRSKFDALVGPYLPASQADSLADGLLGLERANSVGSLLALSVPPAGTPG